MRKYQGLPSTKTKTVGIYGVAARVLLVALSSIGLATRAHAQGDDLTSDSRSSAPISSSSDSSSSLPSSSELSLAPSDSDSTTRSATSAHAMPENAKASTDTSNASSAAHALTPSDLDDESSPPAQNASSSNRSEVSLPGIDSNASSPASTRGESSSKASATAALVEKPPYLKILELRVDITERAYLMDNNPLNLAEVVNAHEQVLSAQCFGDLRTALEYQGYPSDEDCRTRIKRVLELDGTSNVALCAQHGIDSTECRQASSLINTGSYSIDSGLWRSTDGQNSGRIELISLQDALRQKGANKRLADAQSQIYGAAAAARGNPRDYSLVQKLEAIVRPALQEVCIAPRLALDPIQQKPSAASSDPNEPPSDLDSPSQRGSAQTAGGSETDPFSDLIKSLDANGGAHAAPTPTAISFAGPNFRRYRLIPDECERMVKQVAEIAPSSPVVQCFRYGPVSLPCIQARRIALPLTQQATGPAPKGAPHRPVVAGGGGFDSF